MKYLKRQLVERTEEEALLLEIAWGKMAMGLGKVALPGLAKGAWDKFKNRKKEKRGTGQDPQAGALGLPKPKSSDLAPQTNRPKPSGNGKPKPKPAPAATPSPARVQKPKGLRGKYDSFRARQFAAAEKFAHPVKKAAKGAKLGAGQTRDSKGRVKDSKGNFVRDTGRKSVKQHGADTLGDVLSAYEGPLRQAMIGFPSHAPKYNPGRGKENERENFNDPDEDEGSSGTR